MTLRLRGILPLGEGSLSVAGVEAGASALRCAHAAPPRWVRLGFPVEQRAQDVSPEMFTIQAIPNGSVHIPKLSPHGARSSGWVTVPLADRASK